MRSLFKICIWFTWIGLISVYAQDTTLFKREYQNRAIDTCGDKIVHLWVGCGHPEHYLQMCDGHSLEKLEIFDRWGNPVHVSANQYNYIELRNENGTVLPQGVYVFMIKYRIRSGELKTSTGYFSFIP